MKQDPRTTIIIGIILTLICISPSLFQYIPGALAEPLPAKDKIVGYHEQHINNSEYIHRWKQEPEKAEEEMPIRNIVIAGYKGDNDNAESASSSQWTRIAPAGCEVHAVAVDHQNEKTVFAGTRGGGLFKSTDGGRNWLAMGCRLPDDKVMAVAVSPFDANLVLAGMERGGICRSADGGTTWEKAAELKEKNGRVLAADPTNQDIVFIGTYMGSLYRSADGGMNWEKQLKGFEVQSVSAVATDPKSAGTVYVGTGYRGVFRKFEL